MIIHRITADQTLPLRRAVLWPNHPIEASMVEGDDSAVHFGGFVDEALICTASLFPNGEDIRLRKFATDPVYQGQGHGSTMMEHLIGYAKRNTFQYFWLDARQSAALFYERFHFQISGDVFYKRNQPYLRMASKLGSPQV